MSCINYGILPQDWIRKTYQRIVVDTCVVFRIKYNGNLTGSVAAHVSVANTTGDLTFEQGASTAAAAVGTGSNPGTTGVIDISDYSTIAGVVREINLSADWEAWMEDFIPDGDIEVTAGNAIYITGATTDNDCTGTNGFAILADTSLETAEIFPVGMTLNGPSVKIHNHDAQVLHEILSINAIATFAGATAGLKIFECDDKAGTSTLIATLGLVTATQTEHANSGEPIIQTKGKRIVVQATDASGAITSPNITISGRSYIMGAGLNDNKLYSNY